MYTKKRFGCCQLSREDQTATHTRHIAVGHEGNKFISIKLLLHILFVRDLLDIESKVINNIK